MQTRSWLATSFAMILCAAPAAAQELDVSGVVVHATTGAPVADAQVTIGRRSTATDDAGRFLLCRVADSAPLTVTAFRYRADTSGIPPARDGVAEVRVALHPDAAGSISIQLDHPQRLPPGTPPPLYIVNGRRVFILRTGCETPPPGLPAIDAPAPDQIVSIDVLGRSEGEAEFGSDGEHGVIYITLRRPDTP